jgi:hypothetical protein
LELFSLISIFFALFGKTIAAPSAVKADLLKYNGIHFYEVFNQNSLDSSRGIDTGLKRG